MTTVADTSSRTAPTPWEDGFPAIPPLENGDRLTRAEFERRYDAMPGLKKAELIEGRVYIPAPARHRQHARPHAMAVAWLGWYLAATPGVEGGDNGSVRLEGDNEPQPDAFLFILPASGGQAHVSDDDYVEGAPELVVEVASSSVSYDLYEKLDLYRESRVQEYVIWRVRDQAIDWLVLRNGRYEPLQPGQDGRYRSEVFPGLWLDAAALTRGDLAAVVAALQVGIASPEHAAFLEQLKQAE